MIVEVQRSSSGYRYRLQREADDPDTGNVDAPDRAQERFRLVDREFEVRLPPGVGEPHPDHHAAALWTYVRPFVGRRLLLPFPVSRRFARYMEAAQGISLPMSSRDVELYRPRADARPVLLFSGGMDSVAASLILPPDIVHLVLDRVVHPDRFDPETTRSVVDQTDLRAVCDDVAATGRNVLIVADDHEALCDPYPAWHTDMALQPALYLGASLGFLPVDSGHVLDSRFFGGYHDGAVGTWRFRRRAAACGGVREGPRGVGDLGSGRDPLGIRRAASPTGLSEVATARIVARSPFAGRSFSCYRPARGDAPGRWCMECDKCFKKLLLTYVARDEEVPADLFESFLEQPRLAAIFERPYFDWHHVWFYLFQRLKCDHWFVEAMRKQVRRGPDLSMLERWYPGGREAIPEPIRDEVLTNLFRYVEPMSDREVRRLERLSLPPLETPRPPTRESRSRPVEPASCPDATPGTFETSHLAINTTVRCQQRCRYCFEGRREGKENLPVETVQALIREGVGQVSTVVFMGAEPTLHPRILDLTRYAAGLGFRVVYSTNGLRLSDANFLRAAVEAGLTSIEMTFSYPDDRAYSVVTGLPAVGFRKLLGALDRIESLNAERRSRGSPVLSVALNCVVSRVNLNRLDEVVAHPRARFRATPYSLSLKRVHLEHVPPDVERAFYVTLRELREAFSRLPEDLESWSGAFRVVFRDFPLCAVPGREHPSP